MATETAIDFDLQEEDKAEERILNEGNAAFLGVVFSDIMYVIMSDRIQDLEEEYTISLRFSDDSCS